jgi:hypothetical protein
MIDLQMLYDNHEDLLDTYRKKLNGSFGYEEPSGILSYESAKDGNCYRVPDEETIETLVPLLEKGIADKKDYLIDRYEKKRLSRALITDIEGVYMAEEIRGGCETYERYV